MSFRQLDWVSAGLADAGVTDKQSTQEGSLKIGGAWGGGKTISDIFPFF